MRSAPGQMRIVAGKARGTKIDAPEGLATRPVTDKIRSALFNIWQREFPGCRFLDLFSGSGSMGLEADSRGAQRVVMVEKSPAACRVIENNLKKIHAENDNVALLNQDVFDVLPALKEKFDIVYLDPPYTVDEIFLPVMEAVAAADILADDGQVVIRTHKEKQMPDTFGDLEKYREKSYGISTVHFYAKKEA